MPSANSDDCISSFPVCISFYSLIAMARTSKSMLDKSGKRGHPCLVADLKINALLFIIENDVCCGFVVYGLYYVEVCFFYAYFLESFVICGCWILSKVFSASIEMIIWFLFFSLLTWCITLIYLYILKNPCIPEIKPICLFYMVLLMSLFARILLRIFVINGCGILLKAFLAFIEMIIWFLCFNLLI